MTALRASTRPVVLLGDPVDHSLSPLLHNAAFEALDLDLAYLALPVAAADLATVLDALGAVGCVGGNVTVPHKQAAHAACDDLTDVAARVGAVNTLWWADGRLHGDNTDVTGFQRLVTEDAGPAVVLGTGGAARAVVAALDALALEVTVVGRRSAAAGEVAALGARTLAVALDDERAVAEAVAGARLVVNATTLGMHGEPLPAPFMGLRHDQVAHDLVYARATTPFVVAAGRVGASTVDGRALLAAQAEDAFVRWTGLRPPDGLFDGLLRGQARPD